MRRGNAEPLRAKASKDDKRKPGLADAAGRAAFYPARAAARAWRGPIEEAVDEVLSAPEIARVIDRALAGSLPEDIARSIVRHRVLERIAAELAASGELERLVTGALSSPQTLELTDKVLASDEMQSAIRHVASSPELRDAVARQTTGLAEDVVGGLRASAVRLDDRAERVVHRPPRREPSPYGGIATRALALATDGLLTVVLYMSVVGIASLVASLVGGLRPEWLVGVLLGSGWLLVVGVYFVLFWSTAGQTPGMRLLHLRVRGPTGGTPSIARSLVRLVGLVLAIVPFFAGFVPGVVHRAAPRPPGLSRRHRRRLRLAPSRASACPRSTGRTDVRFRGLPAREHSAGVFSRMLECDFCGCCCHEPGKGWAAYHRHDPDGLAEPRIALYCPPCAAAEFGHRPDVAAGHVCEFERPPYLSESS